MFILKKIIKTQTVWGKKSKSAQSQESTESKSVDDSENAKCSNEENVFEKSKFAILK